LLSAYSDSATWFSCLARLYSARAAFISARSSGGTLVRYCSLKWYWSGLGRVAPLAPPQAADTAAATAIQAIPRIVKSSP
jgi:hypothetical protein